MRFSFTPLLSDTIAKEMFHKSKDQCKASRITTSKWYSWHSCVWMNIRHLILFLFESVSVLFQPHSHHISSAVGIVKPRRGRWEGVGKVFVGRGNEASPRALISPLWPLPVPEHSPGAPVDLFTLNNVERERKKAQTCTSRSLILF